MPVDIPLRCACGKLRGVVLNVTPSSGTHTVCYCDDCQAFARFLRREEILDEWGGSDVFQTNPGRVRIYEDDHALACMRLSDKGMHRWYCASCKSPVGNTFGPAIPVVGLLRSFMDPAALGASPEAVLGPATIVQTKFAPGEGAPRESKRQLARLIAHAARNLAKWKLTGMGKPSPFFDDETGAPRAAPRVLTSSERAQLS